MLPKTLAPTRQAEDVFIVASLPAAEERKLQRQAQAGSVQRIWRGVYVRAGSADEAALIVRQNWQRIAGALVPGGVVSHLTAMTTGLAADKSVTLSHPTLFGKKIALPGLTLVLLRGPGPLPGDLPLGSTGLHWAGRTRMLLENLGKSAPRRAGAAAVESFVVDVLNASGEPALNDIRDQAAALAGPLAAQKSADALRALIGALLGSHAQGKLRTRSGLLTARRTPVDKRKRSANPSFA